MRNMRMKDHEKHADNEGEFNVTNYRGPDVYLYIYMYTLQLLVYNNGARINLF